MYEIQRETRSLLCFNYVLAGWDDSADWKKKEIYKHVDVGACFIILTTRPA